MDRHTATTGGRACVILAPFRHGTQGAHLRLRYGAGACPPLPLRYISQQLDAWMPDSPITAQCESSVLLMQGLGLHHMAVEDAGEAVCRLAVDGGGGGGGGSHGLGRLHGAPHSQCQYLIDLADANVYARYCELAERCRGLQHIRRITQAIVDDGKFVRSLPGVLDAVPSVPDERHFMLRLSKGGGFTTNANAHDGRKSDGLSATAHDGAPAHDGFCSARDDAEACWHVDNPKSPTRHATGRLMAKIYAEADGDHMLELRSVPLRLSARVRVGAGDAVFMSHVSRGSSVGAVAACTRFEHRGRTPARGWQIELLLTCVLVDADGLSQRLRALGQQFAREREPHAASLASAPTDATSGERAVLDANAQHFVDHPGYAKKAKHVTNALDLQGGPHSWHGSARRVL